MAKSQYETRTALRKALNAVGLKGVKLYTKDNVTAEYTRTSDRYTDPKVFESVKAILPNVRKIITELYEWEESEYGADRAYRIEAFERHGTYVKQFELEDALESLGEFNLCHLTVLRNGNYVIGTEGIFTDESGVFDKLEKLIPGIERDLPEQYIEGEKKPYHIKLHVDSNGKVYKTGRNQDVSSVPVIKPYWLK